MKFSEFDFCSDIMDGIDAMGFDTPSPVQELAIPQIIDNKDLIVCAQTGTGKTAAYLLPIMDKIQKNKIEGFSTLILVPTRELALQIDQQMQGFAYFLSISSLSVYGGGDSSVWDQQKTGLMTGADVIIATPGRLISHLNLGYVNTKQVKHLILDEADRMLDMGFYEDLMQIVNHLPKERQNLMFSATMPSQMRKLASSIMDNPESINIAISKPAAGVLQAAYMVYDTQKIPLIGSLLKDKDVKSVIIFSSTKMNVKAMTKELKRQKFAVEGIHSDLEQNEREEVLRGFRNKKYQILVATDIIARGIDIDSIDLVINFDVPHDAEDYVHRVGRTARAASEGVALTFITEKDQLDFKHIEELIEQDVYKIPVPAELGEAPVYNPKAKRKGSHKPFKKRPYKRK
ncbi:DEAD/DEAH box helicase [Ancylomarina sp. 16SWW S1-10-2]|uniref:DEAD/DEAH box helicase n=1 Tax=Ancylomarina sp. 16SWW S1-10-2 TaxID=2499681 RepID=UPI0012AD6B21|nr:DEAD/DEAH box helicase [Ancylomarina sp. 16SWW S1-10-2]MRT93165.1 DEAD/DEAH box helicase [Ancylomarina sp. 16SWW S1-10-2]